MSLQLDNYLRLRADDVPVDQAAEQSGLGLTEAQLWEADIEAGEVELPLARARAPAREDQSGETVMDDVTTSIRVGAGPEVPIDLNKDLDDPSNAEAKEQLRDVVSAAVTNGNVAADELRLLIERIERVKEEIVGLNDDVRDIYAEAKSRGFDTAAMKRCIKIRKMEPHVRAEAEAILAIYLDALGISGEPAVAIAA